MKWICEPHLKCRQQGRKAGPAEDGRVNTFSTLTQLFTSFYVVHTPRHSNALALGQDARGSDQTLTIRAAIQRPLRQPLLRRLARGRRKTKRNRHPMQSGLLIRLEVRAGGRPRSPPISRRRLNLSLRDGRAPPERRQWSSRCRLGLVTVLCRGACCYNTFISFCVQFFHVRVSFGTVVLVQISLVGMWMRGY